MDPGSFLAVGLSSVPWLYTDQRDQLLENRGRSNSQLTLCQTDGLIFLGDVIENTSVPDTELRHHLKGFPASRQYKVNVISPARSPLVLSVVNASHGVSSGEFWSKEGKMSSRDQTENERVSRGRPESVER